MTAPPNGTVPRHVLVKTTYTASTTGCISDLEETKQQIPRPQYQSIELWHKTSGATSTAGEFVGRSARETPNHRMISSHSRLLASYPARGQRNTKIQLVPARKRPKRGRIESREGSIGTILDVLAGATLAKDLREPPVQRHLGGRGRGLRGLGRRCPVHRVGLDRTRGRGRGRGRE